MKITALDELKKTKVALEGAMEVWKQVPISKDDGSPLFSFRVFTIEPNGHTPYHTHPFEHLNYIIEGRGVMVNEKSEEQKIQAGDFALVLPDEKHQYRNTSASDPLVMICAVPKDYE
jgi:quercetin dioxygenase-like cupin family protein